MQNAKRIESFNEYKSSVKKEKRQHKSFRKMRRNPAKKQWQGV